MEMTDIAISSTSSSSVARWIASSTLLSISRLQPTFFLLREERIPLISALGFHRYRDPVGIYHPECTLCTRRGNSPFLAFLQQERNVSAWTKSEERGGKEGSEAWNDSSKLNGAVRVRPWYNVLIFYLHEEAASCGKWVQGINRRKRGKWEEARRKIYSDAVQFQREISRQSVKLFNYFIGYRNICMCVI